MSPIPKFSSERFVQIEEGPFAFPEFNLRKNALLRPRPRPTASTLADRIKTENISVISKKTDWTCNNASLINSQFTCDVVMFVNNDLLIERMSGNIDVGDFMMVKVLRCC